MSNKITISNVIGDVMNTYHSIPWLDDITLTIESKTQRYFIWYHAYVDIIYSNKTWFDIYLKDYDTHETISETYDIKWLTNVTYSLSRTLQTYVGDIETELATYDIQHKWTYADHEYSRLDIIYDGLDDLENEINATFACHEECNKWLSDMSQKYNAHICTSTKYFSNLIA